MSHGKNEILFEELLWWKLVNWIVLLWGKIEYSPPPLTPLYLTWIVAKATKFIYTDSSQLSSYIMSPSAQSSVASSVIQYMPKSLQCAAGPTEPCLLFLWLFETLSFSLTQLVPLPFLQHLKGTRCTLTTGHLHQLFILADMLIVYQQSVSVWLISSPSFSLHSNKTSLVRISLITHVKFGNFSFLRLSISLPWFIFLHHISLFLISIYSICFLSLSLLTNEFIDFCQFHSIITSVSNRDLLYPGLIALRRSYWLDFPRLWH